MYDRYVIHFDLFRELYDNSLCSTLADNIISVHSNVINWAVKRYFTSLVLSVVYFIFTGVKKKHNYLNISNKKKHYFSIDICDFISVVLCFFDGKLKLVNIVVKKKNY